MGRVVDTSEVGTYKPVPTQRYVVELTGGDWVKIKNGKNAGEDMYKAKLTIVDETAENGEHVQGKVIFRNWNTMTNSLWVYFNDMEALGADPAVLANPQHDMEAFIPTMIGRKAIANVIQTEYRYPEGHAKYGQSRFSNDIEGSLEQLDIPEALQPAGRRRG
jgi:hypothetical protein